MKTTLIVMRVIELPEEEITDEEAVEHYKKRVLAKLKLDELENTKVVTEDAVYSLKDVLAHMEAKDEIGRREIKIEKAYMQSLKKRGEE